MVEFRSKEVLFNGLSLHTEAFGKSSDLACVLIAPKMATARFWTDSFCQYIADRGFFVIRYDHRDVGESSEIDWQKTPYTMSDLAKDSISILDNYGIQQAHFIGDSMGGWICQRIGVDFPQRVRTLVIISAGPIEITDEWLIPLTKEEEATLNDTSRMFASRREGKNLDEIVQTFLPIWRHLNAKIPLDEEMAKTFTRDLLVRTKNKNAGRNHEPMMGEFLATMNRENILQKIKQPTLVILGDKDPVVLPRHTKSVADAIPGSKLVVIDGMGHAIFNRNLQEKIARLIVEHLITGGQLCRKYGAAPIFVILIHGGPGGIGEMAPIAQRISSFFGILEHFQRSFSIQEELHILKELIEKYANPPVVIIGHSFGAWLACLFAAQFPTLVRKLILIGCPPFEARYGSSIMEERLRRMSSTEVLELEALKNQLTNCPVLEKNDLLSRLRVFIRKVDSFDPFDDQQGDEVFPDAKVFENIWKEASALRNSGELLQTLQKLKCPITAIHGEQDPHPIDGAFHPLSHCTPHFQPIVLKECGHTPWIEKGAKDLFYQILLNEIGS